MSPEQEVERPRAVTVIGWIWIVFSAFVFLRSLVNILIWKLLQPAVPGLLGMMEAQSSETRLLRPLLAHFTARMTVSAILSLAVGVTAWRLLRLRPWARVAIQAVCWFVLAYATAFACFWIVVWTRERGDWGTPHAVGLAVGVVLTLALAAGQIAMISMLRSQKVRKAFTIRA